MKNITKEKLQRFIDKVSGKPELFERYCNIFNPKKDFSEIDFSGINLRFKDFDYFNFDRASFNRALFDSASFYSASFDRASFNRASFNRASFYSASFNRASFDRASFYSASFYSASFYSASFYRALFDSASFDRASFDRASFYRASFYSASFYSASFYSASFNRASFDRAKGLFNMMRRFISNTAYMNLLFDKTDDGNFWICYKSFNEHYNSPKKWTVEIGKKIKHRIDINRFETCSYGINVGTKKWCKSNCHNKIYTLHVPIEAEICVPHFTDGKVRVSEAIIKDS